MISISVGFKCAWGVLTVLISIKQIKLQSSHSLILHNSSYISHNIFSSFSRSLFLAVTPQNSLISVGGERSWAFWYFFFITQTILDLPSFWMRIILILVMQLKYFKIQAILLCMSYTCVCVYIYSVCICIHKHTHTHIFIHIYYTFLYVCVCVCICAKKI